MAGRFGLIIGSDDYAEGELGRLAAPTQDVQMLSRVLGDPDVGDFDIDELINRPSYEVQRRIEIFFSDRRPDDLLLLYFSGHGLKDSSGRLYLAMTNTEKRLLNATAVSAAFIRQAMDSTRSRCTILILDCCYSGAFGKGFTAKSDDSMHLRDRFDAAGSVVLTASDAMQFSFEEDADGSAQSVFTRSLVEGLATGAADRGMDGDIDLDELYDYTYDRVVELRPEQRPSRWSFGVNGRIVVARNPRWAHHARPDDGAALERLSVFDPERTAEFHSHAAPHLPARRTVRPPSPAAAPAAEAPPLAGGSPEAPAVGASAADPPTNPTPTNPTSAPRRRRRRAAWIALGTVVLAVGAGLGLVLPAEAGVTVPTVAADAARTTAALHAAGFDVVTTPTSDDTVPKGTVVRVDPAPGRRVRRHSRVTVYVSTGPRQVVVPALAPTAAATVAALGRAGLRVTTRKAPSTTVAVGMVIKEDPKPGTKVDAGSAVIVSVSTGPASEASAGSTANPGSKASPTPVPTTVTVPTVIDKSWSDAEASIRSAGAVPERHTQYGPADVEGLVVRTVPAAGATVPAGSIVKLYLSLGPDPSQHPACSISPATGPGGAKVTVFCRDYAPGENVIVQYDADILSSELADQAGSVSLPVQIPTGFAGATLPGRTFDLEAVGDKYTVTVRYTVAR